jgi:putative transposase
MARQARLDAPGALHHVMGRGIEGIKIFRNKTDREDFLGRLGDLCDAEALKVYAWALLDNHFHLLARTGKEPLSKNMRKLLTGYVVNFNRRHRRYGHLFQNRYKSIICEDDPYLLELTRYIHLNPLRAGIVKSLEELHEYRWCGHCVIMGKVERKWQDQDMVLGYFGKRRKEAIKGYGSFVGKGVSQGKRPELVGGGLVRSLGGWSQVLSLRRARRKAYSDDRVLGSSEFVQSVLFEAEEKVQETLRLNLKITDLITLAGKICKRVEIEESDLRSGLRKRPVAKARRLFAQIAVKKMGYSGAEAARFLWVTTSAVNRLAASEELEEVKTHT